MGDKIKDALKISDLQREDLYRCFDQTEAQCSSVMSFTLKWKELDDHFEVTRKYLENQAEAIAVRERQLGERTKSVEEFGKEVEMKEGELGALQRRVEELSEELGRRENQLDLINGRIQKCNGELSLEEKKLSDVRKSVEDCNGELDWKKQDLKSIEKSVKQCTEEFQLKKRELGMVKTELKESSVDLSGKRNELVLVQKSLQEVHDIKENDLNMIQRSMEDFKVQLDFKKNELDRVRKSIEEHSQVLELKQNEIDSVKLLLEGKIKELEAKEKHCDEIKISLDDYSNECKSQEKKLSSLKIHIEHQAEELESRKKELNSVREMVKRCVADLELKEKELNSKQMVIEDNIGELKTRKKMMDMIQISIEECGKELKLKEEQYNSVNKSIACCSEELESKEKDLELLQKTVNDFCDVLDSKELQLNSIQCMTDEFLQVLDQKGKYFDSLKKLLDENLKKVRKKEFEVEERAKNLEMKEQRLFSRANFSMHSLSFPDTQDGRNLKFLLDEHLKKQDHLYAEVKATLSASADPAKFVLDELCHYLPCSSRNDDMEFDANINRRSCILLLEQLMKLSPHIQFQVREDAMKLANEWKPNLVVAPENSTEVICFMLLLAAFKLVSAFSRIEINYILSALGQQSQVPELRRAIEEADELPRFACTAELKVEQTENLTLNGEENSSPANLEPCSKEEIRYLESILKKHLNDRDMMQEEVVAALENTLDPAKLVLDLMQESYFLHWEKGDARFDERIMWSYILLLDEAMILSEEIQPEVKVAAMKLAVEWKAKLKASRENSFEVLSFLQFLATYELVFFNRDEIARLIEIAAHHRQTPEISRALGFTEKIPGVIQNLIDRKQHLDAVRFCCEFNLKEEFPPQILLEQYLDITQKAVRDIRMKGRTSKEAQGEARDREMAGLNGLIECITECELQIDLTTHIENRLGVLERQKTGRRRSATAPATSVKQRNSKRPRTDEPVAAEH